MAENYRGTLEKVIHSMGQTVSPEENLGSDERLSTVFSKVREIVKDYKKRKPLAEIPLVIPEQSPSTPKYNGFREYIDGGGGDGFEVGFGKQSVFAGGHDSVLIGFDGHISGKPVHLQYRIYDGFQLSLFVASPDEPLKPEWVNVEDKYTDSYRSHITLVEQLCHAAEDRIHPGPMTGG